VKITRADNAHNPRNSPH